MTTTVPAISVQTQLYLNEINRAEKQSPEGYRVLKNTAIAVSSVALGILLALPAAAAVAALAGLSFAVSFIICAPILGIASAIILDRIDHKKHFIGYKIAQIILKNVDISSPMIGSVSSPCLTTAHLARTQTYQDKNFVALLLGLDYRKWKKPLQNCVKDVQHVKNMIMKMGCMESNITTMTDDDIGTDHYPIRHNILHQLEQFVHLLNIHKKGYFHYSGHGTEVPELIKGQELDGLDEVLIPLDYLELTEKMKQRTTDEEDDDDDSVTSIEELANQSRDDQGGSLIPSLSPFIRDNILFDYFIRRLKKDVVLRITTDCCHSGSLFDLPFRVLADGTHVIENKKWAAKWHELADVVKLSGCRDDQKSSDSGRVEGEGAGAMTEALYATLKRYNYHLTYRQLLLGVTNYLKKRGYKQRPQLTSTRPIDLDQPFMMKEMHFQPNPGIELEKVKVQAA